MEHVHGQLSIDGSTVRRTGPGHPCWWCGAAIPERDPDSDRAVRVDAKTCGKKCRQARWRLRKRLERDGSLDASAGDGDAPSRRGDASRRSPRRVVHELAERPIKVAYADPPYVGRALRFYGREESYGGEVDHVELIARLERDYPDGWALSCAADSLDLILPLCPERQWHLSPWIKPGEPPRDTYGLHTCWEALVVVRGRQVKPGRRDWLQAQPARFGGELPGRKPIAFVAFLFRALGLVDDDGQPRHPGDQLDDLFPGTGIVGRAWRDLSVDAAVPSLADPGRVAGVDGSVRRLADAVSC